MSEKISVHTVDKHIGVRVRGRRRELGASQQAVAEALGVSFQQVQKYERGSNRISGSRLWEMAHVLKVPVGYFFAGLPGEIAAEPARDCDLREFAASPLGRAILEAAMRAPPELVEPHIIALQTARECIDGWNALQGEAAADEAVPHH